MTKHFGITAISIQELVDLMDDVSKRENVFASQTHVTHTPNGTLFTAVCFAKEDKK